MANETDRLPFDFNMCFQQYADTMGYVDLMQDKDGTEWACSEAERRCAELFDEFWVSEDRAKHMTMLSYLAMDIAANVSYTIGRAQLYKEMEHGQ